MNPLYNLGIHTMAGACRLARLRSGKISDMLAGQKQTLQKLANAGPGFDLWVHAASLGEFEQARPVIEAYKAVRPDSRVLVSFFSPSGYKVRHNYPLADCVVYLPFDTPRRVSAFLDMARPSAAMFVKYEFWGNYLTELKRRNIPVYLISSIFRPGQIFFRPWGSMFRRILQCYRHIFVQDEASQNLLAGIGLSNVTVAGDTRFDRVSQIVSSAGPVPAITNWLSADNSVADGRFTLVVGSSWPQDEALYIPWLNSHPDVSAIIAPHEFDRARISALADSFDGNVVCWSDLDNGVKPVPAGTQVLIIDCIGLLSRLYRYGDAAIVGGGLGAGIHNINEAAAYGIPVAFGPNHTKFKEAFDLLGTVVSDPSAAGGHIVCAAAQCYHNSASAHAILNGWLDNPAGRRAAGVAAGKYIADHVGATARIVPYLL